MERVSNRDVDILVRSVLGRAPDDDFASGNDDLDPHVVEAPLVVMPVRRVDDNATAHHPIERLLQLPHSAMNVRFDRQARVHLMERDLNGETHDLLVMHPVCHGECLRRMDPLRKDFQCRSPHERTFCVSRRDRAKRLRAIAPNSTPARIAPAPRGGVNIACRLPKRGHGLRRQPNEELADVVLLSDRSAGTSG